MVIIIGLSCLIINHYAIFTFTKPVWRLEAITGQREGLGHVGMVILTLYFLASTHSK